MSRAIPPGVRAHHSRIANERAALGRTLAIAALVAAACAGEERVGRRVEPAGAGVPVTEGGAATAETLQREDPKERAMSGKVEKSDEEWRRELTPEQFRVLRQAGTERPFGSVYETFKKQGEGVYRCAGCKAVLFSSNEKFDSRCGWPSFYDPADAQNVVTRADRSGGMVRTEVLCARCDGHLGHVFTGEGFDTPTDQRYCINGVALEFVPAKAGTETEKETDG